MLDYDGAANRITSSNPVAPWLIPSKRRPPCSQNAQGTFRKKAQRRIVLHSRAFVTPWPMRDSPPTCSAERVHNDPSAPSTLNVRVSPGGGEAPAEPHPCNTGLQSSGSPGGSPSQDARRSRRLRVDDALAQHRTRRRLLRGSLSASQPITQLPSGTSPHYVVDGPYLAGSNMRFLLNTEDVKSEIEY